MSNYVSIVDMVQHIHDESQRVMNGTVHENDWFFYHDALSLMKAKECKEWMKDNNILHRWILPLNGLNSGTAYADHPVGNSPELMPLDCSLFSNLHLAVDEHVRATEHLEKEDQNKFSLVSVKHGVRAYLRILQPSDDPNVGVPTSKRICEDVRGWLSNLQVVYNAGGAMVEKLVDRNGKRAQVFLATGTRGGRRVKGQGKSKINCDRRGWMHQNALESKDIMISECVKKAKKLHKTDVATISE